MSERRRSRRKGSEAQTAPQGRQVDYVRLKNPFPSMNAFSDDRIEAMHQASLEILETDGVKILLPEARALFKAGGAKVDETSEMVWIGREIVEAALATCPRSFEVKGGSPERDVTMELGSLVFQPGAGAPHCTDLVRRERLAEEVDGRHLAAEHPLLVQV